MSSTQHAPQAQNESLQLKVLQEEVERYRLIANLAADYMYVVRIEPDRRAVREWASEGLEQITGYSPEEIDSNGGWSALIHPDDVHLAKKRRDKLFSGQTDITELRIVTKDQQIRWLRDLGHPIWNEQQQRVARIYGAVRDITARKAAEQTLDQERTLLRNLIDSLPDYIYVKDTEGRFLLINEAARKRLRAESDELVLGKTELEFSPYEYAEHVLSNEQQVLTTETPVSEKEEQIYDHSTDSWRWVRSTKTPFYDSQGSLLGLLGVDKDITQIKEANQERVDLFEAISRQREQLRALTSKLAETQETERRLLARELHDQVGQNLTALDLNLNIIKSEIESILDSADHPILSRLTDSVDLVAQTAERIRNVMVDLRPPVLDDYGLVPALRWYSQNVSPRAGLDITIRGDVPGVRVDTKIEDTLFRIAQEALTNVAKHANASSVEIMVSFSDGLTRMTITDNGTGFNPQRILNITEENHWGLITMVERAEAAGGYCWIDSNPDQGTQVIVEVPR